MYASLLSVLLLGVIPLGNAAARHSLLERIAVAPPASSLSLTSHISASGAIVLDAKSGQVIYSRQANVERSMASITKLMTALIIVENHELDEIVTIPEGVEEIIGNKVYLSPGERYTVGDLLSAALIASANDAANVLAQYHSGSVTAFVSEMNERAEQLGLNNTSFADPIGLDHIQQYSTPRDIAWLTKFVYEKPAVAERMGRRWQRIVSLGGEDKTLNHTHALMHQSDQIIAGKTGTTDQARQCLVSIVEHEGRQFIVVLFYSGERYADMQAILEALSGAVV